VLSRPERFKEQARGTFSKKDGIKEGVAQKLEKGPSLGGKLEEKVQKNLLGKTKHEAGGGWGTPFL